MYRPPHFQSNNHERSIQLIADNPLATVITSSADHLEISLTPVLMNNAQSHLEGHFALQNNIWRHFSKKNITSFLFQGPHGYISPSWYTTSPHLPTWNYAVVEIRTNVTLIEDKEEVMPLLHRLTNHFDPNFSQFAASKDYFELINNAVSGVVCFRAKILEVKAKFKLSQNKHRSEINALVTTLRSTESDGNNALADLMQQQLDDQRKG
ncbi:MAG: FMN-binding negative transcriptional regulator [Proteobacteria bacterium]|nr:FMN-binding negative transcriptional regulator [Pseudomonadota bacterium]